MLSVYKTQNEIKIVRLVKIKSPFFISPSTAFKHQKVLKCVSPVTLYEAYNRK
jgi:hypothetical protein